MCITLHTHRNRYASHFIRTTPYLEVVLLSAVVILFKLVEEGT
jgi:hypothetical protein